MTDETLCVKPISPDEVSQHKLHLLPPKVIEVFNELIAENWNGHESIVNQDDVLARLVSRLQVTAEDVFKANWLDVEDIYKEAGWCVVYERPDYGEIGRSFFKFTKSKQQNH